MTPVTRIQQNILAANERRLLNWLCARLPLWMTPDRLTLIGFIGSLMTFAGYALCWFGLNWLWLSVVGYIVNWFGDSLDGSIARYRKIERPEYGYFVDHSIDSFSNMLLVLGLGVSPFIRFDIALWGLAGYFLLSIHTFLSARVTGEFNLTYLAAGPTEMRLMLIALTLTMYFVGIPKTLYEGLSAFDLFGLALGSVLTLLFLVQSFALARRLDPPKR